MPADDPGRRPPLFNMRDTGAVRNSAARLEGNAFGHAPIFRAAD